MLEAGDNDDEFGAFHDNIWILQQCDTGEYGIWGLTRPVILEEYNDHEWRSEYMSTPQSLVENSFTLGEMDTAQHISLKDVFRSINKMAGEKGARAKFIILDFGCANARSNKFLIHIQMASGLAVVELSKTNANTNAVKL